MYMLPYKIIVLHQMLATYTANSIKVDIDNNQMCIMIDRVPKE